MADGKMTSGEDAERDPKASPSKKDEDAKRTPEAPSNFFAAPYEVKGATKKPQQTGRKYTEAEVDTRVAENIRRERDARSGIPTPQVHSPQAAEPASSPAHRGQDAIRTSLQQDSERYSRPQERLSPHATIDQESKRARSQERISPHNPIDKDSERYSRPQERMAARASADGADTPTRETPPSPSSDDTHGTTSKRPSYERPPRDDRRVAPDFSDIEAEIDSEFENIGEGFDHIGEGERNRKTAHAKPGSEPYKEKIQSPASDPTPGEADDAEPAPDAQVDEHGAEDTRQPQQPLDEEAVPEDAEEPLPAVKRSTAGARVATGAIFSITITICLLASPISSMVVIAVLNAFCSFEFFRMMHIDGKLPNDVAGIIVSALYPPCYFFGGGMYVVALTAMLMLFLLVWYVFSPRTKIADLALTLFGTIYCGLMLSSLLLIRLSLPGLSGGILAFGVALSVWGNDAVAYFFGSRFGKHKLAPKISPHKSWEGFWAGIVGSMIAWCLIPIFVPQLSYVTAIIAGLVCGVADLIGDFAESRIKRGAGVKDSGHALPGHGGFLDRCDSMIFVSVVALFVLFLGGMI